VQFLILPYSFKILCFSIVIFFVPENAVKHSKNSKIVKRYLLFLGFQALFLSIPTGVELLLFENVDDKQPLKKVEFNPGFNRTGNYWHVFVPGIKSGQI
jgi:pullulanase/glycogen debranching enzyme